MTMTRKSSKHPHAEHWIAVSTLLGLISSACRDHHLRDRTGNPRMQKPNVYQWATSLCHTETMSNQLVMVRKRDHMIWWWSQYALLMRPNKVETAVQCSVCHMWVFAGFSGHGNLINIISIPLIIYIYIYIYACEGVSYSQVFFLSFLKTKFWIQF